MSVTGCLAINPTVADIYQSRPKWWTDRRYNTSAMAPAWHFIQHSPGIPVIQRSLFTTEEEALWAHFTEVSRVLNSQEILLMS